jgi:hypothetical protein
MGNTTIHDNVILLNDRDATNLIIVGIGILFLHLALVILLGLDDVSPKHLRVFYFYLRIVENVVIVVDVFYNFYWLLLVLLLFWFRGPASALRATAHCAVLLA